MSGLNFKNVILIDHSMAGDIILRAAVNAPERVICLVGVDNFTDFGHIQTREEKSNFEKIIQMLKHNFREYYVHGTGHYPMIESPEAFNAHLDQAITGIKK
jgi:pimeloyl-ACP methyl ester carboxylesterase